MTIKYIDDLNIENKKVLIRVDYNVPYDKEMKITDDTRIKATLPTLNYCLENNCKIILVSHLGRPKGKIVPEMSLEPVAEKLSQIINKNVIFSDAKIGYETKKIIESMNDGDILLLENIRFYPGEEKNDDALGKKIASLTDIYINDAFATAHRGHSSNESVTKHVNECAAGFLLKQEIEYFKKAMGDPKRPLTAVLGGAKVSGKLDAITNIMKKVDSIIIGGGMAFTFIKALGHSIGNSLLEKDLIKTAKEIMEDAKNNNTELLLPVDIIVANEFDNNSPTQIVEFDKIPKGTIGLDIGPKSIKLFEEKLASSKTVVWNGPMGAFEMSNFANGTNSIANIIAETDCLSIVGGGDSVTAINQSGVSDKISYISTGGGAFLELLEGKTLPALAALDK